jgi:hypothetical protein
MIKFNNQVILGSNRIELWLLVEIKDPLMLSSLSICSYRHVKGCGCVDILCWIEGVWLSGHIVLDRRGVVVWIYCAG